jgi:ADP-ribosylglycohydrolase
MRSAVLGVACRGNRELLRSLVRASTRLTHTDPKAEHGALAVAVAAGLSARGEQSPPTPDEYVESVRRILDGMECEEFIALLERAARSVKNGHTTQAFAKELGLSDGVTGYMYHTAPVVIHAWLANQDDYRSAMIQVIECGGDTDTTAAILGGIIGARVGRSGIPEAWLDRLWEWPRTVTWMENLGEALARSLAGGEVRRAPGVFVPALLLRNLLFLFLVLLHGLRRTLPPY